MLRFAVICLLVNLCWAWVQELIVRYAVLDPDHTRGYLRKEGLPMLRSTLCLIERYLTPAFATISGSFPSYFVYTDNRTHGPVNVLLSRSFGEIVSRIKLINLDSDADDNLRLESIRKLQLDAVNFAAVRRTLADAAILPSTSGRLLLGLDVSFVAEPRDFLAQMMRCHEGNALYMADLVTFAGQLYTLPAYRGPQCPGLLGDFVYLSPGLEIAVDSLQAKMRWYAEQPRTIERTSPPTEKIVDKSDLHAIDQFALNLALAEKVKGIPGCLPLRHSVVLHQGGHSRYEMNLKSHDRKSVEAIHDKVISSCGLSCYDKCSIGRRSEFGQAQCALSAPRCRCLWCFSEDHAPDSDACVGLVPLESCDLLFHATALDDSEEPELAMLTATICLAEVHLASRVASDAFSRSPTYVIYTSDRLCGRIGLLLFHAFPELTRRITLINIEGGLVDFHQRAFCSGVSCAGVMSCMSYRKPEELFIALEITYLDRRGEIVDRLARFNRFSKQTLQMLDALTVHTEAGSSDDDVAVTVPFCLCGAMLNLSCPIEQDLADMRAMAITDLPPDAWMYCTPSGCVQGGDETVSDKVNADSS